MCDTAAKRTMASAFGIDMNPLMIERRFGEQIDARLIDREPFAGTERCTHGGYQRFGMGEYASGLAMAVNVAHTANATGAADVADFSHNALHHAC